MVSNPNKENKMEDPKLAMKQMRSIVKEFLPKFAAGEVIDNCTHFGDVARDMYTEDDIIRLVICLQDVATSEKAKKDRAGEHIINLKNHMNDLRELIDLLRRDTLTLSSRNTDLTRTNADLNLEVQELHEALAQAYTQRDAAMILLKDAMNG